MQASIDHYGRVLIPKAIRDHLGLRAGSLVEIEETDHNILLKTMDKEPQLKLEEGIFVFTGKLTGNAENVLEMIRAERLKGLEGT